MFNKKQRLLIVLLVVVVVIAAIVLVVWQINKDDASIEMTTEEQEAMPAEKSQVVVVNTPVSEMEKTQANIENLSKDFAQRFGTYSVTSGMDDLLIIKNVMTTDFYSWVENTYKKQLQREYNENSVYTNVLTQAIVVNVKTMDEQNSRVVISTKRTKKKNGNEPLIFNQDLTVDFVQENGQWLVDSAYWEK